MNRPRWLLGSLVAAAIGAAAVPLGASAQVYVEIQPPPPRYEILPVERPGYVWAPGYWDRRGGRWVWIEGRWMRERPGLQWYPSRWVERDGRWYFRPGRWERERYAYRGFRDSDRDGIPNRYDRDRDNDGIPNRYDRDRDNDGVPNRFDDAPNNPYRR